MAFTAIGDEPTQFDQLIFFEKELEKSERNGLTGGIAENRERYDKINQTGELLPVIWDRLFRLGYLPTKCPSKHLTTVDRNDRLERSIKKMQRHAGLVDDGWVGLHTWGALQDLFSFEDESNLQRWSTPNSERFLMRAVELRMAVLGIFEDGTVRAQGRDVKSKLKDWRALLILVNADGVDNETSDIVLYEWLFNIERLSHLFSDNFESLRSIDASVHSLSFSKSLTKCLLKIELWLYGYDGIQPGRHGGMSLIAYKSKNVKRAYSKIRKRSIHKNDLSKVVSEFCKSTNLKVSTNSSETQIVKVCLWKLSELSRADDNSSAELENRLDRVNDDLSKLSLYKARKLSSKLKENKGLGARVFDGIKRGLRWLYSKVAKVFKWLSDKVSLLASIVKKFSVASTSILRRTFKILSDGISVLTQPIFPGSTLDIALHHDKDFDFKAFISDKASTESVDKFLNKFNKLMLRLRASFVICSTLIETIYSVLRALPAGPLAIISVLVRIYKIIDSVNVKIVKAAYLSFE